jgi:uncharacterized protein (TIGR00255 family)
MTAFARVVKPFSEGTLIWEIRSVNHRYLDINTRLPEMLRSLEMDFRHSVREHLERGKIDLSLSLNFSRASSASHALTLDTNLAKQLVAFSRQLSEEIGMEGALSMEALLRWPGVVITQEPNEQDLLDLAKASLVEALNQLVQNRSREGEKLMLYIRDRLTQIGELVSSARASSHRILTHMKDNLLVRLQDLKKELHPQVTVDISDTRLEQELLFYAQKMEVSEEMDRLSIHVDEAFRLLTQQGGVGRKFDFLLQEFNREANTLGSKSSDAELSKISVELKVLIEQIREQIQNIE